VLNVFSALLVQINGYEKAWQATNPTLAVYRLIE